MKNPKQYEALLVFVTLSVIVSKDLIFKACLSSINNRSAKVFSLLWIHVILQVFDDSSFIYNLFQSFIKFTYDLIDVNTIKFAVFSSIQMRFTHQFPYAIRHDDAVKMTTLLLPPPPPPPPALHCYMRHSQNLDKNNCFLKPILNIFIFRNLTVDWYHQMYRFSGVNSWGKQEPSR